MRLTYHRQHFGVLVRMTWVAARRSARHSTLSSHRAWRPVALFWRKTRKLSQGMPVPRLSHSAGEVWHTQVHLHFLTHVNHLFPRASGRGLSPATTIHSGRITHEHRRNVVHSTIYSPQVRGAARTAHAAPLFPLRSNSSGKFRIAAPYEMPARRHFVTPNAAWAGSRVTRAAVVLAARTVPRVGGAAAPRTAPHTKPDRRASGTTSTARPTMRAFAPVAGQTHLYVRLRASGEVQSPTLEIRRMLKPELLQYRLRPAEISNAVPSHIQEHPVAPASFATQGLVWRRALPTVEEIVEQMRQSATPELTQPPNGRSFSGRDTAFGMSHSFGTAPATQSLKLDEGVIERLAEDVIRRVDKRARIERERRGF